MKSILLTFILIIIIAFVLMPSQSVKADDDGWVIDGCSISNEIEVGKPIKIVINLKYTGTAPSQKKKFDFTVIVKKDDEVEKTKVSKEVDVTQPGAELKLSLKGPKLEDTGNYIVTVENSVATLATKQLVLQE